MPCAHLQMGGTALHRAADLGREDLVQLLLSHGAHASAKDDVSKQSVLDGDCISHFRACHLQGG